MGVVLNIGATKFPEQDPEKQQKRVAVRFRDNSGVDVLGTIVRSDAEEPYQTIIKLDDGRYILDSECMYRVSN